MTDQPYSKRELDLKFEQIKLAMDEKHQKNKETLNAILTQTKTTNGRVSNLENWRWFIMGGLAILTILVVPLIVFFLTHK